MRFWQLFTRSIFIVLIMVMLSLASHPVDALTTATPASQPLILVWQTATTPDAVLDRPVDIAVDEQGNIYVNQQAEKHIKKFDKDGKYVMQWGSTGVGEGQLSLPGGIAVDSDGNIYAGDFSTMRILKFDSDGKFLMQWSTEPPAGPGGIAVDKDGNVYNDNFGTHEHYMQKFDRNGKLVTQWGTTGKDDGQFGASENGGAEDVTIDKDGNIYVADRLNQRIQKFDADGKFLAKFGGNGESFLPSGVAVDGQGNIYAVDTLNYFMRKLDSKGNTLAQWPIRGNELDGISLIAVDWDGNIYVYAHPKTATGGISERFVVKKFKRP